MINYVIKIKIKINLYDIVNVINNIDNLENVETLWKSETNLKNVLSRLESVKELKIRCIKYSSLKNYKDNVNVK